MAKINSDELIRRIRARDQGERQNITFRLPESLLEAFRKKCEKEKVSLVHVVEELMKAFLSG